MNHNSAKQVHLPSYIQYGSFEEGGEFKRNHVTVGVYSNGEFKVNIVRPEHLESHIQYNADFRPGRMLFVDGKYAVGGVLKKEYQEQMITEWEEKIGKMSFDTSKPSSVYV